MRLTGPGLLRNSGHLIVCRYTLTYTPSLDRILPAPSHLHVKIRNSSAIPLRAAYLHGPYTLYTACYPSTFDPNHGDRSEEEDGAPSFEPNLKAGGSWISKLTVPERIRDTESKGYVAQQEGGSAPSFTWIIDISAQVIFSASAAVGFELLVSRDEKSLELGFSSMTGQAAATPGQLEDHQQSKRHHGGAQPKGVYSHAVKLIVDDTASLWNKPPMPEWDDGKENRPSTTGLVRGGAAAGKVDLGEIGSEEDKSAEQQKPRKRRKVHLVVLTHGLHSNLGADMLYLKESIDLEAKKAREDRRRKRQDAKAGGRGHERDSSHGGAEQDQARRFSTRTDKPGETDQDADEDDDDDEEVIVRGYPGNATRTEKGVQYLGKRLAKWILSMTYPDQPFLPAKKTLRKRLSRVFSGDGTTNSKMGTPEHKNSSIYKPSGKKPADPAYKITSISFIGHSLGGLTQTYAIAYIHKHSPHFFDDIRPINFVAMAVPFLGLSNENPIYVKFALDFGLVGRTGQDLGLAWKSSTALRGGWDSMIAGVGNDRQRAPQPDPGSKPLLRILPTGHTHHVLKMFRNRTVYSNVVNDGIVPLRTSCLLFLDWSGLGRVEKARRENGLIGGLAGWGWAELTGANASSRHLKAEADSDAWSQSNVSGDDAPSRSRSRSRQSSSVPPPEEVAVKDEIPLPDDQQSPNPNQFFDQKHLPDEPTSSSKADAIAPDQQSNPLQGFLSFFRPTTSKKPSQKSPKQTRIYKRSQTVKTDTDATSSNSSESQPTSAAARRPGPVRGQSILEDPNNVFAPPKTTIFESAGDLLNPPLPTTQFIVDPKTRPRTIFHDRVYHPGDIPPPPAKRPSRMARTLSSDSRTNSTSRPTSMPGDQNSQPSQPQQQQNDTSGMKVEEKIARAYHHDLSWRKVLVRLEPDAHNNMVVRRMFANAYGWPVVKHLVDTHFADTYETVTADKAEPTSERAKPPNQGVGAHGEETKPLDKDETAKNNNDDENTSTAPKNPPAPTPLITDNLTQPPASEPLSPQHTKTPPNATTTSANPIKRTDSEVREASDSVPELTSTTDPTSKANSLNNNNNRPLSSPLSPLPHDREDSISSSTAWDDLFLEGATDEEDDIGGPPKAGTSEAELDRFLHHHQRHPKSPVLKIPKKDGDDDGREAGGMMVASPMSTTSLGLGKRVEEQIRDAKAEGMGMAEGKQDEEARSGELRKDGVVTQGVRAREGEEVLPDLSELQVGNGH